MQYIFKNTIEQSICGQQINRSTGKHDTAQKIMKHELTEVESGEEEEHEIIKE